MTLPSKPSQISQQPVSKITPRPALSCIRELQLLSQSLLRQFKYHNIPRTQPIRLVPSHQTSLHAVQYSSWPSSIVGTHQGRTYFRRNVQSRWCTPLAEKALSFAALRWSLHITRARGAFLQGLSAQNFSEQLDTTYDPNSQHIRRENLHSTCSLFTN